MSQEDGSVLIIRHDDFTEAAALINRQNAEIEALKNSKSEAIKEFAVRVKMEINFILLYYKLDKIVPQLDYEVSAIIQKIEKEMTEDENG